METYIHIMSRYAVHAGLSTVAHLTAVRCLSAAAAGA